MRRDFQKPNGKFNGINENTHCVDLLGGPPGGGAACGPELGNNTLLNVSSGGT